VLGNIDRRAAILAAQRKALDDAQQDDDDGRSNADGVDGGDQAHAGRRDAHQRDGDEKGIFAPQPVTQKAEQHRAQRAEGKADRKG
jgi:hypothetical protein